MADMDLTTTKGIEAYLRTKQIPFDKISAMSGGLVNFVWRVEAHDDGAADDDNTTVIKHAAPYVKAMPHMAFSPQRMDLEVQALSLLPEVLQQPRFSKAGRRDSIARSVRTPRVLFYDAEWHVLRMSFGGDRTLKEAYADRAIEVREWGDVLGTWLADLHVRTRSTTLGGEKNPSGRLAYDGLEGALRAYGHERGLGEWIKATYGSLLATDDECICHGDFWPGNVLVAQQQQEEEKKGEQEEEEEEERKEGKEEEEKGQDEATVTVVDWEMVRRGCGAVDVGQFAAEAFLLDTFRGDRGLLGPFLQAYRHGVGGGGGTTEGWTLRMAERVAAHFGTHLGFWPTQVEWGSRDETAAVVQRAVEILSMVKARDWTGLLREGLLRELFIGLV